MTASMCISYRNENELFNSVAQYLESLIGHAVEVKPKLLKTGEFDEKVKCGGYDGQPYTVFQLSEKWNCSENYIREEIKRGRLTAFKAGKRYYVTPSNVKKYEGEQL